MASGTLGLGAMVNSGGTGVEESTGKLSSAPADAASCLRGAV